MVRYKIVFLCSLAFFSVILAKECLAGILINSSAHLSNINFGYNNNYINFSDGDETIYFYNDYESSGVLEVCSKQFDDSFNIQFFSKSNNTLLKSQNAGILPIDREKGRCESVFLRQNEDIDLIINGDSFASVDSNGGQYFSIDIEYFPDSPNSVPDLQWANDAYNSTFMLAKEASRLNIQSFLGEVDKVISDGALALAQIDLVSGILFAAVTPKVDEYGKVVKGAFTTKKYFEAADAISAFNISQKYAVAVSDRDDLATKSKIVDAGVSLGSLLVSANPVSAYQTIIMDSAEAILYIEGLLKLSMNVDNINASLISDEIITFQLENYNSLNRMDEFNLIVRANIIADNTERDCGVFEDLWGSCGLAGYNEGDLKIIYSGYFDAIENYLNYKKILGNPYIDADYDGYENRLDEDPNDPNIPKIPDPPEEPNNRRPVSVATVNGQMVASLTVNVNSTVTLDGSDSYDPDGDSIEGTHFWELYKPSDSNSSLSAESGKSVEFIPDRVGTYQVKLTVTDNDDSPLSSVPLILSINVEQGGAVYTEGPSINIQGRTISGCGEVFNQTVVTVPAGEYWRDISFIISSDSDSFVLLVDQEEWPTFDIDEQQFCDQYGLTGASAFSADLRYEYRPSQGTVWEDWGRDLAPGDKLYVALGSIDNTSNTIGDVNIVKHQFYDHDGDGVSDADDWDDNDPNEWADSDGDNVGDNRDQFSNDPSAWEDTDGDGCPNSILGDSLTGLIGDQFPNNGLLCVDSDGDNVDDRSDDRFPDDSGEWADSDNDGIGDNADKFDNDWSASIDTDDDGYPDEWHSGHSEATSTTGLRIDKFTNDPTEWEDSDSDGVGDNSDWAVLDPTEWMDSDGDGVGDNSDAAPLDASRFSNSDPQLSDILSQNVEVGETRTILLSAIDTDGDLLEFNILSSNNFVSKDGNVLYIRPTSNDIGEHIVVIKALDNFGGNDVKSFSVIVEQSCISHMYYEDRDSDGYGNPISFYSACSQPNGYVKNNGDCDDNDMSVNIGAEEICGDSVDNNCNSEIDENKIIFYLDSDGDNFGNPNKSVWSCTNPVGYVETSNDCNDSEININPISKEICGDKVDNNCDGNIDELATCKSNNRFPWELFLQVINASKIK